MLKAVLDTNTLYSGILYEGPESDLLEMGRSTMVGLYVSEYVYDELRGVFARRGLSVSSLEQMMGYFKITVIPNDEIRGNERYHQYLAESKKLIDDPKDRPVYVFAKTMVEVDETTYLITGNKDLLNDRVKTAFCGRVLKIKEFIEKTLKQEF